MSQPKQLDHAGEDAPSAPVTSSPSSLSSISDAAATDLAFRDGEAMRVEDVMRVLHLSKNTVYKLARTGELPSFRVGRQLRFRYDDVLHRLEVGGSAVTVSASMLPTAQPAGASGGSVQSEAGGSSSDGVKTVTLGTPSTEDVLDEVPQWARGSIIIGGQDIAGDILANYLAGLGIKVLRSHSNAYVSLSRMYMGTCHAVLLDLWSEAEQTYNKPYVRAFLPGIPAIVFRMYRHRIGFTVAAHNPHGINSWADLTRGVATLVNRPRGDGSRVLLDEKLKYLEATTSQVKGYDREATSELAQGLIVARGLADVAITGEKPFRQIKGLDFLPMQQETVELCIIKTKRTAPMIKALRSLLRTNAFRSEFDPTMDDVGLMGEVVYES